MFLRNYNRTVLNKEKREKILRNYNRTVLSKEKREKIFIKDFSSICYN